MKVPAIRGFSAERSRSRRRLHLAESAYLQGKRFGTRFGTCVWGCLGISVTTVESRHLQGKGFGTHFGTSSCVARKPGLGGQQVDPRPPDETLRI
jgi:hypothetical protein